MPIPFRSIKAPWLPAALLSLTALGACDHYSVEPRMTLDTVIDGAWYANVADTGSSNLTVSYQLRVPAAETSSGRVVTGTGRIGRGGAFTALVVDSTTSRYTVADGTGTLALRLLEGNAVRATIDCAIDAEDVYTCVGRLTEPGAGARPARFDKSRPID